MSDAASKPGAAGAPNATGAGGVAPQPNTIAAGAASGGGGSSAMARPPAAPAAALRVLTAWLLDLLAAQLAVRLRAMEERERDPDWGMVSQRTLPAWIHAEAYVDACRAGRVEGARLWRRQWIARREAVDRWWTAESRPPDGGDDDPEGFEATLRLNGLDPDPRRRGR